MRLDVLPIEAWIEVRPITGSRSLDVFAATPFCGDGLDDCDIHDGDYLVFLFTDQAREGDLVIALTPSGNTVKFLKSQADGTVLLLGANDLYEDEIWERAQLKIRGVVKEVLRFSALLIWQVLT